MSYALIKDGQPFEVVGSSIVSGDVQFSRDTMLLWSPEERLAHLIYEIIEPSEPPEGKYIVTTSLAFDGSQVTRVPVYEDIPVPEPIVPDEISDRQFAQGLANQGVITQDEALAWAGPGTIPAALLAFTQALAPEDQFTAKMLLTGATVFKRSHPLTDTFAAANGWSKEQTDGFWTYCSTL